VVFAFVYSFYVQEHKKCDTISECYSWVFANFLDFAAESGERVIFIRVLFGIIVVIVLLNVVIAIVSEAWHTAELQSTKVFWKYRVEKIAEVKYLDKFRYFRIGLSNTSLIRYIDNMENISYANDISWAKAPYYFVSNKDQYDKPLDYFSPEIATEISNAKSLLNDLHWAKMDARHRNVEFTISDTFKCILNWLGRGMLYAQLIIMGTLTCGFFFPRNFRQRILSVGHTYRIETVSTPENTPMTEKSHTA